MAGLPDKSAQTWAPEAVENQTTAQSQRPSSKTVSESGVSREQGIETTGPAPVGRCEGRVLGGTAGLPDGSAQTWTGENQTVEELSKDADGDVINTMKTRYVVMNSILRMTCFPVTPRREGD